jgi:hypothetical protein
MPPQAREHSLDELAIGLASGSISRGKALRLMGAAVVGGALASVGMREATAAPGGCKRNGKSCKNDDQCCSTHCEGGTCAACPSGQEACGGGCGTSNGGACSSGSECCSGNCKSNTCVASCIPPNAIPCDPFDPDACGGVGSSCGCVEEASGGAYCSSEGTGIPCTTACDCPPGQFCQPFGGTGGLCTRVAEVCTTPG